MIHIELTFESIHLIIIIIVLVSEITFFLPKPNYFSIHEFGKNIDETNQYGIQRRLGHLLSIRFALLLF